MADLDELLHERDRLRAERDLLRARLDELIEVLRESLGVPHVESAEKVRCLIGGLRARVAELETALGWYADACNYYDDENLAAGDWEMGEEGDGIGDVFVPDAGQRARAALRGTKGGEDE